MAFMQDSTADRNMEWCAFLGMAAHGQCHAWSRIKSVGIRWPHLQFMGFGSIVGLWTKHLVLVLVGLKHVFARGLQEWFLASATRSIQLFGFLASMASMIGAGSRENCGTFYAAASQGVIL